MPPDSPLPGWLFLALLTAVPLFFVVWSARHGRGWGTRLGTAVGAFVAFALPSLAVGVTQDLTCRDGGVLHRPDGGSIVVGFTAVALVGIVALFWLAGDRAAGSAWRLAVVPLVLLVPVVVVEVMVAVVPLEDFCDGVHGLLVLQMALALGVPVATLGLALAAHGSPPAPSRVPPSAVLASVLVLLAAQVAIVARRLPPDPIVCTTARPLSAPARDAVAGRGYSTDLSVAAADFDGDGSVDLAGLDESGAAHVLRNDGRGNFTAGPGTVLPATFPSGAVAAGDLDGNGYPDLVVAGSERIPPATNRDRRRGVAVLLNDGTALQPHGPLFLPGSGPLYDIALGDLDGDGNAEVVVLDGGTVAVLWNRNGELDPGPRLRAPAPADGDRSGQSEFALADIDGDRRLDVVSWVRPGLNRPSYVIVHRSTGSRTFASSVVATVDDSFYAVAVADFDGDGDVDVVAHGRGRRLQVLVNRGDGRFDVQTRPRRLAADGQVAADVDGDGRPDLVLSTGFVTDVQKEPGWLWVRRNLGGFSFSDAQRVATPRELVVVADLNGDRRADFVVDQWSEVVVLMSTDC